MVKAPRRPAEQPRHQCRDVGTPIPSADYKAPTKRDPEKIMAAAMAGRDYRNHPNRDDD
jgi:hypothetical protein